MERHSLIQHIHRQRRFTHAIIARHTLAQHMREHQLVPQALGLRAQTTQPISKPTIQSVRRLQPLLPLRDDPELQTLSSASSIQNEVELSSAQLISEPQESIDIPASDVDQYIMPEQDAEAASITNTEESILPIPLATFNAQQESTGAINEQAISMPETLAPLLSQETTQPDLLDPQHVNTDEQSQHIPSSSTIPTDTHPQQRPQIDQQKDESGQAKLHFDPAPLEQSTEADRVAPDQPVQAQQLLNEPSFQPAFSNANFAVAANLASALGHPQQAQPSQDNQRPVTGNTQEQRPRRRGRIEEQPQHSTSNYNQATRPSEEIQRNDSNARTSEVSPTNAEQPISDVATPQTSKFSPQEWYARLVKSEREAQAKQTAQGLTPTIPQQTVHDVEPTRESLIPDNQSATDTKHSTELTARNDSTPIKGIPLVKNATNNAAMVTNELPTSIKPTSSTPLSQRARRFLRPLVGIDPTSVDIYRDRQAEQLTTAYRADAVAIGNDVALAAEHPDDTPETLGLLAHELTHVARQREPRFIPPIVRPANTNQSPQPRIGIPGSAKINGLSNSAIGYNTSASEDEEALAQRVEARVTRAARNDINQEATTNSLRAGPTEPAGFEATSVSTGNTWGGLPAPWEPLPNWLVGVGPAPTQDTEAGLAPTQNHVGVGLTPTQWIEGSGIRDSVTSNTSNLGAMTVQRAGKERGSIDDELYSSSSQQSTSIGKPGNSQQELEPDLDDLARQVYTRLKHRLGVENRRERL